MAQDIKVYTRGQILEVMPQQPPFLFLDRAEIKGDSVRTWYKITGEEFFLKGHFKDNPVFPGTLMLETLGQAAVFYLIKAENSAFESPVDAAKIFFLSADDTRCMRICRPGDILETTATAKRLRMPLGMFTGAMMVGKERAAFAEKICLTFGYKDK